MSRRRGEVTAKQMRTEATSTKVAPAPDVTHRSTMSHVGRASAYPRPQGVRRRDRGAMEEDDDGNCSMPANATIEPPIGKMS